MPPKPSAKSSDIPPLVRRLRHTRMAIEEVAASLNALLKGALILLAFAALFGLKLLA